MFLLVLARVYLDDLVKGTTYFITKVGIIVTLGLVASAHPPLIVINRNP